MSEKTMDFFSTWGSAFAAAVLSLMALSVNAQTGPADFLRNAARMAPDVKLPAEPGSLGVFASPSMALYKPEGQGPFPALVLLHQCAGLGSGRSANMSMLQWAREAISRGWVVLQLDSLGPRGVDTVCYGAKAGVNLPRGARDALQAARHLAQFPFVDKERIALAGYSWGAMNALFVSSKSVGSTLAEEGVRFGAAVAFYPGCFTIRPDSGPAFELMRPDVDRPLLVLMGGKDTETPASECVPKLEAAKAAGAPVQWHLYPDATHCWDCKHLDGFRKTDFRGASVEYRYSEASTRDSTERMFTFLDDALKIKR